MPLDVLLVDDHKIMRDGIKAILSRTNEFRVVGEAENGPDAVQFSKQHRPHLVLMDIGLPGLNGVETTQEILRFHAECKIVILSMYDDENSVMGAIRAGARAFILKRASDMDLVEALRMVAAGGIYLSPQVSDRLLTRIQKGDLESHQSHSALEVLRRDDDLAQVHVLGHSTRVYGSRAISGVRAKLTTPSRALARTPPGRSRCATPVSPSARMSARRRLVPGVGRCCT